MLDIIRYQSICMGDSSTRVLEYPGIRIDIINNCLSTITVITYTESDYYLMYYS